MLPRPLPVAALLVVALCGCLGDEPLTDPQASEIVNGEPSHGDDAVVALTIYGQQYCSGTLVTPDIVVTAAHCLPPNVEDIAMKDITVFVGDDLGQSGTLIPVAGGLADPDWSEDAVPGDIGMLVLAEEAPVAPLPLLTDRLTDMAPIGKTVRVVGFGITSAGGAGNGVKRSGEMLIEGVDSSTIYLKPEPSATCSGDSGGPLFFEEYGVEKLAGINSRSDCHERSYNERVDVHVAGFIRDFLAEQGEGDCGADGLCGTGCAEPDPDCPCVGDGLCTEACPAAALDTDPDCPPTCSLLDGECPSGCPGNAPDCGAVVTPPGDGGSCSTSGGGVAASSWLLWALTALALSLVLGPRRRGDEA